MHARRIAPFAVLAAAAACSHKISSPSVRAGKVQPDLVCAEQITTAVTLTGDGFTPMPNDTLKTAKLILPSIVLTLVQDLLGGPASGETAIPDDPAHPEASLVHWKSAQEMSFDVAPSLHLQTGFYDIRVTNPDGKSSATFALGLAAVPRPAISGADRLAICDAQDAQTVVLTGTGFLTVGSAVPTVTIGTRSNADFVSVVPSGCVALPGAFAEGVVSLCTVLTVTIPQGLFAPGDYPVTVTNPPPASCHSSETVVLHVEPPPIVTGTLPATLCQGGGTLLVNGQYFLPAATVDLVPVIAGPAILSSASATVNPDGTQISAIFGGGGEPPNKYDVVVDNHDGCTDAAPHKQITVVTGPVAFFADPEVVYNGIATLVTVYVTTIQGPADGVTVYITPHGAAAPQTPLVPIAVPGHPNRVQVVIPAGQAVGAYDLHLDDATSCPTILPNAIRVTASTTIAVKAVTPSFGWTGASTATTVQRDAAAAAPYDQVFLPTPRLFLNPAGATSADVAIQLASVSFVDQDTLTAVVPANQPARTYDLIVVNPNGTVGVLPSAFAVNASPPPVVNTVTPSSLVANATQTVIVSGTNFSAGATASLTCQPAPTVGNPVPVTLGAPACAGSACTVSATIDSGAAGIALGSICVLRLTNADGAFFDYSALGVTNSSLNLVGSRPGSAMTRGRRALVAAAGNATPASRFVYAVGGDGGAAAAGSPYGDAEMASVDLFGNMGTWRAVERSALATPRAFAAAAAVGRYLYVFGGTDGTGAVRTAERAMILDPAEVPQLDVGDIFPAVTGLEPGYWLYRVSAVFAAGDADNPGGESLPSDEIIVRVPSFPGKKIQVILAWQPPRDALGAPLPGVAGYNVYRTPAVDGISGGEVLLATVAGAATLQYTDDGSAVPGAQTPLPFGSLGRWALLPEMTTARSGHAGAAAFDPDTAGLPGTFYVYALLGLDGTGTPLTSYEYLPVTVGANGHQAVGAGWTARSGAVAAGRSQVGAWVADRTVSGLIGGSTAYVYVGGGLESTDVDSGQVATGGDLGVLGPERKFGATRAGYGVCAANGQLFAFGGQGGAPTNDGASATITTPPPALASGAWNSLTGLLQSPRYLSGSAVQSAFIFLVGGQTGIGAAAGASNTCELVIW